MSRSREYQSKVYTLSDLAASSNEEVRDLMAGGGNSEAIPGVIKPAALNLEGFPLDFIRGRNFFVRTKTTTGTHDEILPIDNEGLDENLKERIILFIRVKLFPTLSDDDFKEQYYLLLKNYAQSIKNYFHGPVSQGTKKFTDMPLTCKQEAFLSLNAEGQWCIETKTYDFAFPLDISKKTGDPVPTLPIPGEIYATFVLDPKQGFKPATVKFTSVELEELSISAELTTIDPTVDVDLFFQNLSLLHSKAKKLKSTIQETLQEPRLAKALNDVIDEIILISKKNKFNYKTIKDLGAQYGEASSLLAQTNNLFLNTPGAVDNCQQTAIKLKKQHAELSKLMVAVVSIKNFSNKINAAIQVVNNFDGFGTQQKTNINKLIKAFETESLAQQDLPIDIFENAIKLAVEWCENKIKEKAEKVKNNTLTEDERYKLPSIAETEEYYQRALKDLRDECEFIKAERLFNNSLDSFSISPHVNKQSKEIQDLLKIASALAKEARTLLNEGYTPISELTAMLTESRLLLENLALDAIPLFLKKTKQAHKRLKPLMQNLAQHMQVHAAYKAAEESLERNLAPRRTNTSDNLAKYADKILINIRDTKSGKGATNQFPLAKLSMLLQLTTDVLQKPTQEKIKKYIDILYDLILLNPPPIITHSIFSFLKIAVNGRHTAAIDAFYTAAINPIHKQKIEILKNVLALAFLNKRSLTELTSILESTAKVLADKPKKEDLEHYLRLASNYKGALGKAMREVISPAQYKFAFNNLCDAIYFQSNHQELKPAVKEVRANIQFLKENNILPIDGLTARLALAQQNFVNGIHENETSRQGLARLVTNIDPLLKMLASHNTDKGNSLFHLREVLHYLHSPTKRLAEIDPDVYAKIIDLMFKFIAAELTDRNDKQIVVAKEITTKELIAGLKNAKTLCGNDEFLFKHLLQYCQLRQFENAYHNLHEAIQPQVVELPAVAVTANSSSPEGTAVNPLSAPAEAEAEEIHHALEQPIQAILAEMDKLKANPRISLPELANALNATKEVASVFKPAIQNLPEQALKQEQALNHLTRLANEVGKRHWGKALKGLLMMLAGAALTTLTFNLAKSPSKLYDKGLTLFETNRKKPLVKKVKELVKTARPKNKPGAGK